MADKPNTLRAIIDRYLSKKKKNAPPREAKDTNLPDESAGQTVAVEETFDTVTNAGRERPFLTARHDITGGSPKDPRWNEFNRRKTLQGAGERATSGLGSANGYLRKVGR